MSVSPWVIFPSALALALLLTVGLLLSSQSLRASSLFTHGPGTHLGLRVSQGVGSDCCTSHDPTGWVT